jgi:uncharacterized protein (TIGR02271 family)
MAKNVVGLFESRNDAQAALSDLQSAGFSNVNMLQNASSGLSDTFDQLGIPQDDAQVYMQGIQSGGAMVLAQALPDDDAMRAAEILDRHNIVDISNRGMRFQQSGMGAQSGMASSGMGAQSGMASSGMASGTASSGMSTQSSMSTQQSGMSTQQSGMAGGNRSTYYNGGGTVIPIVEEEIQVGKQQVESGGVRVNTRVEEVPVQEQVTLRDEQVHVERRPVDRPASQADFAAVQQAGTLEVRETDEQAVVSKQARVVEEVVVNKEVQQRTENIQDTVRRTDVDVQELGGQMNTGSTTMSGTTGTTGASTSSRSSTSGGEGLIEGAGSRVENAAERLTGSDLNRDGDVGQRDPRNNVGGV